MKEGQMRNLFITMLAVGLLGITNVQAQNRISRHQLDITTGVSCHFQSGKSLISLSPVPAANFTYTFYVFPHWGLFSSMGATLMIREGNGDNLRKPYKNDHYIENAYDLDDDTGPSMAFGVAYRLNKPVWDVQLRLGYYLIGAEEHDSFFYIKEKNSNVVRTVDYDQTFSVEPGGFVSALQTSVMLSRRIWRKIHLSVEAKYISPFERATQTFEKRNLLTGEVEDAYLKRVRVHYLEVACGISWHL